MGQVAEKPDSRWDLVLWDRTCPISPTVRVRIVSRSVPYEVMKGMTGGLVPCLLDKSFGVNVLGESHGRREKEGGGSYQQTSCF